MFGRKEPLVNRLFIVVSILILLISINTNIFYNFQTCQNEINPPDFGFNITSATKYPTLKTHGTDGSRNSRADYSYHNYTSLVSDLMKLNNTYLLLK